MVDDVEKSKENLVTLLRSIKSVDDLKENKDEILKLIEEMFSSAVQALKNFLESSPSMSPEEKNEEMEKYQGDHFLFDADFEKEMDRIDSIPGAEGYFEEFTTEMEKRVAPLLEEFTRQMAGLMAQFMGGMMEGMAEGLGGLFGEMEVDAEEESTGEPGGDEYEDEERNPDLEWVYNIDSLEKFKAKKEGIIDHIEGILQSDFDNLQYMNEEMPNHGNIWRDMEHAEYHQKTFFKEMSVEFERIAAMPDGAEFAKSFKDEFTDRITPISEKLTKLIEETRARMRKLEDEQNKAILEQ